MQKFQKTSFDVRNGIPTSNVAECVRDSVAFTRQGVRPLPGSKKKLEFLQGAYFACSFSPDYEPLPQVGKMKRKLGPRPSQEVRRNPGQSRSERQSFVKID